jgi:hypothetical protein
VNARTLLDEFLVCCTSGNMICNDLLSSLLPKSIVVYPDAANLYLLVSFSPVTPEQSSKARDWPE